MQIKLIERELGRRVYQATSDNGRVYKVTHRFVRDEWRIVNDRGITLIDFSPLWLYIVKSCETYATELQL